MLDINTLVLTLKVLDCGWSLGGEEHLIRQDIMPEPKSSKNVQDRMTGSIKVGEILGGAGLPFRSGFVHRCTSLFESFINSFTGFT